MDSKIYTAPVPRMPPGLIELMEGLVKDVLRNNPTNVYEFCTQHMEKLLKIRDDATEKSLSLSQKIIKAQQKVRQRAQLRRAQYKELQLLREKEKQTNKIEVGSEDMPICYKVVSAGIDNNIDSDHWEETIENNEIDKKETVILNLEHDKQIELSKAPLLVEVTESKSIEAVVGNDIVDKSNLEYIDESGTILINETNNNIDNEHSTDITEEQILSRFVEDIIVENNEDNSLVYPGLTMVEQSSDSSVNKDNVEDNALQSIVSKDNITDIIVDVSDDSEKLNKHTNNKEKVNSNSDYLDEFENQLNISGTIGESRTAIIIENRNNLGTFSPTENHDPTPDEKELDFIGQNNMDLEKAAITIQKVFRTFLFRSKTSSVEEATNVDINQLFDDSDNQEHEHIESVNSVKDKRTLGLSRLDSVLQTVNEEKSLSLSTDDSSTLSSAATIIQAHVRGFLIRNKLNLNKTFSTTSNIDSDIQSPCSLEKDMINNKNKTILNIHIIPEGENFLSRDESMMTSIDLPLDGSPPSSANLHPLGYDKNEPRKQLKREDAVQSISPPSNNSGKSDDIDSVKEVLPYLSNNNIAIEQPSKINIAVKDNPESKNHEDGISNVKSEVINNIKNINQSDNSSHKQDIKNSSEFTADEMDVITPYLANEDKESLELSNTKLLHSGEFHDIVLPTMVSRSNTSVVREFQNVLVYFLLWNNP